MRKDLKVCPSCKGRLTIEGMFSTRRCEDCKHDFDIQPYVPVRGYEQRYLITKLGTIYDKELNRNLVHRNRSAIVQLVYKDVVAAHKVSDLIDLSFRRRY